MPKFLLLLQIWRLSLIFIIKNFRILSYFLFFPIVVLSLFGVASTYMSELLFAEIILHLILYVMFAVAWHKFILAPDSNRTVWQYLKWDIAKWRYLGVFFLMSLGIVFVINITVRPAFWLLYSLNGIVEFFKHEPLDLPVSSEFVFGTSDLLALAAFLGFCLPLSRLMLLFPQAALGGDLSFKIALQRAWILSRSSLLFCFLLFLSLGAFQLIFGFLGVSLRFIFMDYLTGDSLSLNLIQHLIWQSYNYLTLALLVTPLSLGYKALTDKSG